MGKASNLRSRVRSYFSRSGDTRRFVGLLERELADLEWFVTGNEKEALLLECTLIKKLRPRYNVQLRDDKNYVLVRVDRRHPYPRLQIVRRMEPDGAEYLGPFPNVSAARAAVRFASRHFGLRICSDRELRRRTRACVHCQMSPHPAPCVEQVDPEDYRRRLEDALLLLTGRSGALVEKFRRLMEEAAEALNFEQAARYRDLVQAIQKVGQNQDVVLSRPVDWDVIGLARKGSRVEVCVLEVRAGAVAGRRTVQLQRQRASDEDIARSFAALYYTSGRLPPREVVVPVAPAEVSALSELLSERRGSRVRVSRGVRGRRRRLLELARKNAEEALRRRVSEPSPSELVERLAERLRLRRVPARMECFDVSTLQGTATVVSMAVFVEGRPAPSEYRRFRVETGGRPDDYSALRAALQRRFRHLDRDGGRDGRDGEPWPMPDLLVVDGGKGQLQVALSVLSDLGLGAEGPDLVAVAKGPPPDWEARRRAARRLAGKEGEDREEERISDHLYLPKVKDPIPVRGRELLLLAALRDEAHRFAVAGHRRARRAGSLESGLERIPGIGPARRKRLLERFGSLEGVAEASLQELRECGMPESVARKIVEYFARTIGGPSASAEPDGPGGG